ncbi:RNA-binding RBM5 and related containing G-patch and RRM domains (ISS) [Chlorella sorokiniana]|uniref:RNA-binding RBM5 and related containing G-patch and RRM domains (ISS) n=1 Tax=Chlorella sorokiniana TaxID=3076 RepID=A0A2P6TUV9_CHLSO|nr:RNA-binding RBM5 and related containing G-patch and RRM domains (ISS) [Chlorella sorokiniana]|eukprot:PRW57850.1 RNA-binding RBM5 and related containing G-patch and RRM domains (ISS) [Chlorella sorokiniana]
MQAAQTMRAVHCRPAAGQRRGLARPQRAVLAVPRAQQQGGGPAPADAAAAVAQAAAATEQQAAALAESTAQALEAEQQQQQDEVVVAVSETAYIAQAPSEQQEAQHAVAAPPPPSGPGGLDVGRYLSHPAVRTAGIAASVFLGGTLLFSMWKVSRDPEQRRRKTMNKNKAVVDTISRYLPGNRAGLSGAALKLLGVQTGFSNVEVFRKYLWFMLRERAFDEEALADLVALKAALGLTDEQVAEALAERAKRVYEKYGTVMVNLEGFSQSGIERQATARNLFMKLLSMTESRQLLSAEAASEVDLSKIFGVTPRDILTLRSGYSAEAEGQQGGEEDEE